MGRAAALNPGCIGVTVVVMERLYCDYRPPCRESDNTSIKSI